jgi:hypothetical protein
MHSVAVCALMVALGRELGFDQEQCRTAGTAGLLWLGTMMAQFFAKGFRENIRHRYLCFSLFWHTLDIIWVALFSLVYLVGSLP